MYCRYCGKELPSDSNYCPNCGKKQIDAKWKQTVNINNQSIIGFIRKHKIIAYSYIAWFLLHLTLYISSEKYKTCEKRFYPFDESFSDVIYGSIYGRLYPYYIEFFGDSLNYYNFTEFLAYVILLPLVIYAIVRLIKSVCLIIKIKFSRFKEGSAKNDSKTTGCKSLIGKGCKWVVIVVIVMMLQMCITAIMKQQVLNRY